MAWHGMGIPLLAATSVHGTQEEAADLKKLGWAHCSGSAFVLVCLVEFWALQASMWWTWPQQVVSAWEGGVQP